MKEYPSNKRKIETNGPGRKWSPDDYCGNHQKSPATPKRSAYGQKRMCCVQNSMTMERDSDVPLARVCSKEGQIRAQKIFSAYPSSLKIVPIFFFHRGERFLPAAKRSSGVFGGWIIFRQMGHNKSSSRGGMRPGRGGNWGLPRRLERLQEGARATFAQEGREGEKKSIHFKP
ncbi:hypothetical protein CEXT_515011 [Caerostris extrusa]|uniref:Uncharacterized protein n=1 Tax=Caerostris extrusa TaxID=172846 RepID=A0AAV4SQH7_CAEEX|nr:hypothetical protein CEXT_515011 [Caerostris extrusa]